MLHTAAGAAVRRLYVRGERVACASRGWATLALDALTHVTYVADDYLLVRARGTHACAKLPGCCGGESVR